MERTLFRDAALIAAAFALCPLVALVAPGDPAGPLARLHALVDFERDAGLDFEPAAWRWFEHRPAVLGVVGFLYVWGHVPATVGALVWARLERPRAFPRARNAFLATQALVVTGYLLFPTAPPYMLGGVVGTGGWVHSVQSPYAAVPSGHVAFAVFVAWLLATQARALRVVAWAYPLLVAAVVIGTRNHLWVDVVTGALAAALACQVSPGVRLRRQGSNELARSVKSLSHERP